MRRFRWLGGETIPPDFDLRPLGWRLVACEPALPPDCPVLVDCRWWGSGTYPDGTLASMPGLEAGGTRWLILLGIEVASERARLLLLDFGEVLPSRVSLAELGARAGRLARQAEAIVPVRHHGQLRLDLLAREGFVGDRALGLHPREFALLWRLMDSPGEVVDKASLLRDVWHRNHMPETNSIAVHASRLRAKLTIAGLGGMMQTASSGGYFLVRRRHGQFMLDDNGEPDNDQHTVQRREPA